jgi:hypothetical protein
MKLRRQQALRPPRAGAVAPRRSRNQARRGRVQDRGRFRPPPSAQGCLRRALRARPGPAQSRAVFVRRRRIAIPRSPAHGRPSSRAARARDRAPQQAHARLRRCARSGGGAGSPGSAHARRSPGRREPRASPAPRPAPSQASPGRARRARSRPRRRGTSRGPRPLSGRRRAPPFARATFARTRSPSCAIAMPRSASAGASSRRATRFSAPRGSPAASARAAAVISESIRIPSHLSLPPSGFPLLLYLTITNQHVVSRTVQRRRRRNDDETHDRDT